MTPLRQRQLHGRALAALGEDGDVIQRAHHAIGAGDAAAVVELAARAADACVALGAWREAALLYGEALEHSDRSDPSRRRLLEARATIGLRVELVDEAVAAGDELLVALEAEGDEEKIAECEAFLSRAYRAVGRGPEAAEMAYRAVARLEPLGDSAGLARALSMLTGHELVTGRYDQCIKTSRRAIALSERFDLEEDLIYALDSLGAALGCKGQPEEGIASLREAFDRAKRASVHEGVTRASANLAYLYLAEPQPTLALAVLDEGIAVAEEHELHLQLNCLHPSRAEVRGMLGDWDGACAELATVLKDPWASPLNCAIVRVTLARIHARRGDPGLIEVLDELLPTVVGYDEAQLTVPLYLARAEASWLNGDLAAAAADVEASLTYLSFLDVYLLRDVYLYARRTGVDWEPDDLSDPVMSQIASGDHHGRARYFAERQCVYEAADALADSDDPDDVRQALDQLTALGARPRAGMAVRRLRELGVRDVPRGPRASTRANPAGLTSREVEVATLLAQGHTNAEIADQLIVAQKTVDHHVSSVLTKLGVSSRRHVVRAAAARGLDLHAVESATGT
jgi:DNA-binding CsgD family transcriptional regulator/tetratricopeptide (TPR) repeat protein